MFPLSRELRPAPDPLHALRRFADLDGVMLLESAARRPRLGRYSFLTAKPVEWFQIDEPLYGSQPFRELAETLSSIAGPNDPELPPFQGGAAGLLSYDLGRVWERLPQPRFDEFQLPVLAVGLYDWVIGWDHDAERAWIVSQGFCSSEPCRSEARALSQIEWVLDRLSGSPRTGSIARASRSVTLCPQHPVPSAPGVTSNFTPDGYRSAVERVIEYIRAGDIFQANLTQRLLAPANCSSLELYERLRIVNPAPFSGYFSSQDWVIASSSPERFVQVRGGAVETRPIKGTRPRSSDAVDDARLRSDLVASEKDRAENVMIVDLLRNDLSKVCRPGSVKVPELCTLESYETVHHLVSAVEGLLEPGRTAWDLFAAAFPGGSITGAPKLRAMEIIEELEPTARGPYCGSLFYVGVNGDCDSSILIRTMVVKDGYVQFGVGGGVTAQSDPVAEYDETLHKAAGMLRALGTESQRQ